LTGRFSQTRVNAYKYTCNSAGGISIKITVYAAFKGMSGTTNYREGGDAPMDEEQLQKEKKRTGWNLLQISVLLVALAKLIEAIAELVR
jgi:hypothetical protein